MNVSEGWRMGLMLWGWRSVLAIYGAGWAGLSAAWAGYPLLIWLWGELRPTRWRRQAAGPWPSVSIIVAAHNEAGHIAARIADLQAQEYGGWLEILISEDGSDDGTADEVRRAGGGRYGVRLLSNPERLGKAAAINRAVAAAHGTVLVFTDANNAFAPGAITALVAALGDARVGAATGRKTVSREGVAGAGEGLYWRFERWLTAHETRAGGTVAAFGEALALRRELFVPLPTKRMLNDDRFLAFQVLRQRRVVVAVAEAVSREAPAVDDGSEWERRRRMSAGRWEALATLRGEGRRLGWGNQIKLVGHEWARPLSGLALLLVMTAGTALLWAPMGWLGPALRWILGLQAAGAVAVLATGVLHRWGWHGGMWESVYFFCLALLAALAGSWRYLRGRQSPLWTRARRAGATPSRIAMDNGKIVNGLFWASSSFVMGKLLVFGSVVILARLLAPLAFGEVALATAAVMVLETLCTLGLTSALIFEERDVGEAANLCFGVTLGAALLGAGLAWVAAPLLARFFHEPSLAAMVRVLLAGMLLTVLGNTHDTLLRRRLAFRAKLVPDVGQAAIKGGASIVLALAGWGAWSLIWGQVLGSVAATALLWWINRWRPRLRCRAAIARRQVAYAKHIYLLDGSSVVLSNLDTLTIGRMLSDAWLGFYTLAFRIPEVLLLSVLNVITRVAFPALSRLQSDRGALRRTLLDMARYQALLTLPMAVGVALLARPLVYGLYGRHWGPSIAVLQVLAIYAGFRCLTHSFGDGYKAIGRPDILTRTTLLWWLFLPPALILGVRWGGIVGAAWGQVVTRVAMTAFHVFLLDRFLEIRPRQLWRCYAPTLEATTAMGVVVLAAAHGQRGWPPRLELACLVPLGALVYFAWLQLRFPRILQAAWMQMRRRTGRSVAAAPAPVAVRPAALVQVEAPELTGTTLCSSPATPAGPR